MIYYVLYILYITIYYSVLHTAEVTAIYLIEEPRNRGSVICGQVFTPVFYSTLACARLHTDYRKNPPTLGSNRCAGCFANLEQLHSPFLGIALRSKFEGYIILHSRVNISGSDQIIAILIDLKWFRILSSYCNRH